MLREVWKMRWIPCAVVLAMMGCVTYSTADDDVTADDDSGSAGDDDSAVSPTGVEVQPPERLDFGTVEECTSHTGEIVILNHGPDSESVDVEADDLLAAGFTVEGLQPQLDLVAGEQHVLTIGLAPGPGGAGEREGHVHVVTVSRWFDVLVVAEVVTGDEC